MYCTITGAVEVRPASSSNSGQILLARGGDDCGGGVVAVAERTIVDDVAAERLVRVDGRMNSVGRRSGRLAIECVHCKEWHESARTSNVC